MKSRNDNEFNIEDNTIWLRLYDEETGKAKYAMISKTMAKEIAKMVWGQESVSKYRKK